MKKLIIYNISIILFFISAYFFYQILKPSNTKLQTPEKDLDSQQNIKETQPNTNPNSINTPRSTPITKPTPTPDPQTYACDLAGNCNSYLDPKSAGCPITFNDQYCENKCSDPSLRCNQ